MSYAFARFVKVNDLAFLGAMERHAKREDSSALRVDKSRTGDALLYSPYNDDMRGIVQAFKNMKRETGASERGKNAFGAHLLLCVSPDMIAKHGDPHDPENPANQALFQCAIDYAEDKFGKGSVIHARLDVDEKGSGVVDVITIPVEEIKTCGGKKTALKCLINKPLERLIAETGTPKVYGAGTRALQSSWHEYACQRLDHTLQRGRPKEETGREHVYHTVFADAAESIKLDKEKNARNSVFLFNERQRQYDLQVELSNREVEVKKQRAELFKLKRETDAFTTWWGKFGLGISSLFKGVKSIKSISEKAFLSGRKAGREERQSDVDAANRKADQAIKARDRAVEDLKREKEDRARDNVIPAKDVPEYAMWKSQQRTKNVPAGPERSNLRGYGF